MPPQRENCSLEDGRDPSDQQGRARVNGDTLAWIATLHIRQTADNFRGEKKDIRI